MSRLLRPCGGQAAIEYVGLLALLSLVGAAGLATLAPPDLAASVVRAVRVALCRVSGGVCDAGEARAAGLAPCLVHARSDEQEASVTIGVVRLGRGDTMELERRSDGTASVAFVDRGEAGGETGLGVRLSPIGLDGRATVGGGVTFAAGRKWDFPDWASAEAFARRFGPRESLRGEAEALCPVCGDRPRPEAPAETYREGGVVGRAGLDGAAALAGRRVGVDGDATGIAVLGHRVAREETTWYARLDATVLGRLGLVLGAVGAESGGSGVLEYTTRAGRPATVRIRTSRSLAGELTLLGSRVDLGTLAGKLREATAGGGAGGRAGVELEAAVELDLTDPANRAAVDAVLRLQDPVAEGRALRALADRIDRQGGIDLDVYRTTTRRNGTGAGLRAGVGLEGEYERTQRTRDLVGAWSLASGGPLRDRDDCAVA